MEADKDKIDIFTLNIPDVQHSKSHVQGQTHRRIGEEGGTHRKVLLGEC